MTRLGIVSPGMQGVLETFRRTMGDDAPELIIPKPLSRAEFEDACEMRFRVRGGVTPESARFFAKTAVFEFLDGAGIVYGAPGYLWTHGAARDLADREIDLWREAE